MYSSDVSNQLFDMVGVNRVTLVEEGFEGGNVELADIGGLGATYARLVVVRMLKTRARSIESGFCRWVVFSFVQAVSKCK